MDLFTHAMEERMQNEAPLAARMRPRTLDEIIGQEHIIGEGRLLRRAIEADRLFSSMLLSLMNIIRLSKAQHLLVLSDH